MRFSSLLSRVLAACGLLALLIGTSATPAAAEPCDNVMPMSVVDARGYTFVGTLSAKNEDWIGGARPPSWTFVVEQVFAGENHLVLSPMHIAIRPAHSTTLIGACAPVLHLVVGRRYLISKADLLTFSSASTVAWSVNADGTVDLVREYGSRRMDPRFAQPKTRAEAVALMVPGLPQPTRGRSSRRH